LLLVKTTLQIKTLDLRPILKMEWKERKVCVSVRLRWSGFSFVNDDSMGRGKVIWRERFRTC
jgi:hypothetical protein